MAAATCPLCASVVPEAVIKGPPTTVFTCPVCGEVLTWSRGRAISSKAAVSKAKALHGDLLKGVDEVLSKPAPALPPAPVELAPRPPPVAPAAPTKLTGPRPVAQPKTFTVPAPPTRLPGTPMVQAPIAIAPEPLGIPAPPISEPLTRGPGVRPAKLPVPAPAIASLVAPPAAKPVMETRGATAVAPAPAPVPPAPAPQNTFAPATPAVSPAVVPPATPAPAPAAPAPQPDVLAPATPAASVVAVPSPAPAPVAEASAPPPATSGGRSKVPLAPVALAVMALLAGGGWAFFGRHSLEHTDPVEAKEPAPAPAPAEPAPVAEPAPAPAPAPVAPPSKASPPPAVAARETPAEEPKPAPAGATRLGGKKVVLEYDKPGGVAPAPVSGAPDNSGEIQKAREVYQAGNAKLFNGDAKGAREAYLEALKVYPGYVAGYRGLGFAYEQEGDARNALTAFKLYVKTVPTARDVSLIKKRIDKLQRTP